MLSQKLRYWVIQARINKIDLMMPNSLAQPAAGKVHKIPSLKDNFGLTKAEFLRCIANMKQGDDSFITHNMVHQLPESMTYLQNRFHIDKETAYDICMDTFIIFRDKLFNGKISYGNLRYLFTRMCQNCFIDGQKKKNKIQTAIDSLHKSESNQNTDKETFFLILDKAIDQLPSESKILLVDIYHSGLSLNEIAIKHHISYDSIRKKKERILKKLRALYSETCNKQAL